MINWHLINSFIVCIVSAIVLVGCTHVALPAEDIPESETTKVNYEVTETDIFEIDNISVADISVLGIKLGDDSQTMLNLIGEPDIITPYSENTIFNCEYSEAIGLDEIGLIVHLEDDIITRITLLEPFSDYLVGSTDIFGQTKYDVYADIGVPDRQKESITSKIFYFDETGIDIVFDLQKVKGISFRLTDNTAPEDDPGDVGLSPDILSL